MGLSTLTLGLHSLAMASTKYGYGNSLLTIGVVLTEVASWDLYWRRISFNYGIEPAKLRGYTLGRDL